MARDIKLSACHEILFLTLFLRGRRAWTEQLKTCFLEVAPFAGRPRRESGHLHQEGSAGSNTQNPSSASAREPTTMLLEHLFGRQTENHSYDSKDLPKTSVW